MTNSKSNLKIQGLNCMLHTKKEMQATVFLFIQVKNSQLKIRIKIKPLEIVLQILLEDIGTKHALHLILLVYMVILTMQKVLIGSILKIAMIFLWMK